jgi:hypothetical protein
MSNIWIRDTTPNPGAYSMSSSTGLWIISSPAFFSDYEKLRWFLIQQSLYFGVLSEREFRQISSKITGKLLIYEKLTDGGEVHLTIIYPNPKLEFILRPINSIPSFYSLTPMIRSWEDLSDLIARKHSLHPIACACLKNCSNRFNQLNPKPWTLVDLAAFSLRNQYYFSREKVEKYLPKPLFDFVFKKSSIRDIIKRK